MLHLLEIPRIFSVRHNGFWRVTITGNVSDILFSAYRVRCQSICCNVISMDLNVCFLTANANERNQTVFVSNLTFTTF